MHTFSARLLFLKPILSLYPPNVSYCQYTHFWSSKCVLFQLPLAVQLDRELLLCRNLTEKQVVVFLTPSRKKLKENVTLVSAKDILF